MRGRAATQLGASTDITIDYSKKPSSSLVMPDRATANVHAELRKETAMSWNLPPDGVTDRMVDEAFGYKEGRRGVYTVTIVRTIELVVEVDEWLRSGRRARLTRRS